MTDSNAGPTGKHFTPPEELGPHEGSPEWEEAQRDVIRELDSAATSKPRQRLNQAAYNDARARLQAVRTAIHMQRRQGNDLTKDELQAVASDAVGDLSKMPRTVADAVRKGTDAMVSTYARSGVLIDGTEYAAAAGRDAPPTYSSPASGEGEESVQSILDRIER